MAHAPHKPTQPLDETDPHGETGHHGHVIIPARVLLGVLLILLFFTILTVFCSRAEVWISKEFNLHIPQLVNVLIALSIAVVKSALVAMYFMQLKYDSPLNALVFLFCLFALGLFLFFSMTDLGTRAALYDYKAGEVTKGGLGMKDRNAGKPNALWIREQAVDKMGTDAVAEAEAAAHHHADHDAHATPPSDASRSRPLKGPTSSDPAHAPADPHAAPAPAHAPSGGGH